MSAETPLMRQYNDIKSRYPGSILFFRMGDFYEMFGDDAVVASKVLQITLTSRNKNKGEKMPLCGVPYHAADAYIAKLIKSGHRVAVCEQVEDPRTAKGIVKREVIRVITPGTVLEDNLLSSSENNFLMAVSPLRQRVGIAALDISTGEFYASELPEDDTARLMSEIARVDPKEILLPEGSTGKGPGALINEDRPERLSTLDDWSFDPEGCERRLQEQFGVATLDGFGLAGMDSAISAAGAALGYLAENQPAALTNITRINVRNLGSYMYMDENTMRNLELVQSPSGRKGTLIDRLDRTVTSMGARRLRSWLTQPQLDLHEIRSRHEAVGELVEGFSMRDRLRENMKYVYDLERLMARIASGVAGPRDMAALRSSLEALPLVKATVADVWSQRIGELNSAISDHAGLSSMIGRAIEDEPPANLKDGGVIRQGYSAELDELRGYSLDGKGLIARIEADERQSTGIDSLKVKYNKVFGYYIEVTKPNLPRVPDYFIRKQTLVNAERFVTPELKEYEEKVLGAEERIAEIEASLFAALREEAASHATDVQRTSEALSELDALASFAESAVENGYTRPDMDDSDVIRITDGRHPVVEALTGRERYVPNDTLLDRAENRLLIITGPNMAGKSTYMRQVALIVLMAQVGSFVPAASAGIGLVDRIFTRVGASDNIARGQSTFMVEMNETANILHNATPKSLIIMDEIGRGTSTFDGVSIAWAVAEHIHDKARLGARTLFATHYHELTELAATCPGIKNYNISVREWKDEIVFLRKIVEGGADKSYGIQVARLAGLPRELLGRARAILRNLERSEYDAAGKPTIAGHAASETEGQMDIFASQPTYDILCELDSIDIMDMTPLEALMKLGELKDRAARIKDG
jgi:DNA mismatch repair protein MutS